MRNKINKYEGKHCEVCGTPLKITRDHIVPKWLENRFSYFQLDIYMVNNDQYLCETHNSRKGGIIDYKDERVRRFLRKFIKALDDRIVAVEKEIRTERFKATMEAKKLTENEKNKKDDKDLKDVRF